MYLPPPAPASGSPHAEPGTELNAEEQAELATPEVFKASLVHSRWEVIITISDGSFQQVSFVNSICTSKGGTHVKLVTDQIVDCIVEKATKEAIKKKLGKHAVKATVVRDQLSVFINCLVENPTFDSQTKDTLTLKAQNFGSSCLLTDEVKNLVLESGVVESVLEWAAIGVQQELNKKYEQSSSFGRKATIHVPKLDDANWAGTKRSKQCTLILTEGDSAKTMVTAGMSQIGRDKYGVFALRGKLLNIRDTSLTQTLKNTEIHNLLKILALDPAKEVATVDDLRYGCVMIMTDQDLDGSHIKGLLINLFQFWFPKLLAEGFLKEFITPLVKCTKANEESKVFFSSVAYEAWQEATPDHHTWNAKYYKGLGTSTAEEAREYFSHLEKHEVKFLYGGKEDDDLIDMAFKATRADDRKAWINRADDKAEPDTSNGTLSYADFINVELVQFSKYSVRRQVPNVVDGLKPSQRKVMFACFKKKLKEDLKVAQLSGYISEQSQYHHGEVSLQEAIVKLAQNFVGANNVNYLVPSGQFGSRSTGGKDHASARYIYTRLSKVTRFLFRVEDDPVLEYLEDEGKKIEPRWYCPIIPTLLVNGATGMGTGWSTQIPQYNPRDILENCRRYIRGQPLVHLVPWFRGFKGTVKKAAFEPVLFGAANPNQNKERYEITGVAHKRTRTMLEITELPVGKWTVDYKKDFLQPMLPNDKEPGESILTDMREYHAENSVHFVLSLTPDKAMKMERGGLERALRLKGTVSMENMHAFSPDEIVTKYASWREIFDSFILERVKLYEKRKVYLMEDLERQLRILENKVRFIQMVIEETLVIEQRKAEDLVQELTQLGFVRYDAVYPEGTQKQYDYLLKQRIGQLTQERADKLIAETEKKREQLDAAKRTPIHETWLRELDELEAALDDQDKEDANVQEKADKLNKKSDNSVDLTNSPCCIFVNSKKQIRRVAADLIRKVHGKNNKGRPVGNVGDPKEEELRMMVACHSFDTILACCSDGTLVSFPALRIPSSKVASSTSSSKAREKGNHAFDIVMPEVKGKNVCAMVSIADENAWENKLLVIISQKGYLAKARLSSFKRILEGNRMGTKAIKLRDEDAVQYIFLANPDDSVLCCLSKGSVVVNVPVSRFPLRNKGGSGNRLRLFMKLDDDPSLKISVCICPAEPACETKHVKIKKPETAGRSINSGITGYTFFVASVQSKQREDGGKASRFGKLGEMWRHMSAEEKQPWDDKAVAERERRAELLQQSANANPSPSIDDEDLVDGNKEAHGEEEDEEDVKDEDDAKDEDDVKDEEDAEEEDNEGGDGEADDGEDGAAPDKVATTEPCVFFMTALGRGCRYPLTQFPYVRQSSKGMKGPKLMDPADEVVALALTTPARVDSEVKIKGKTGFFAWFSDPLNKEEINRAMEGYDSSLNPIIKIQHLRKEHWPTVPAEIKAKYDAPTVIEIDDTPSKAVKKEYITPFHRWWAQHKDGIAAQKMEELSELDSSLSFLKKFALVRKEVFDQLPAEEKQKYDPPSSTEVDVKVEVRAEAKDVKVELSAEAKDAHIEVKMEPKNGKEDVTGAAVSSEKPAKEVATGRVVLETPTTREDLWIVTRRDHVHRIRPSSVFFCKRRRHLLGNHKIANLVADDRICCASVLTVEVTDKAAPESAIPVKTADASSDVKMCSDDEQMEDVKMSQADVPQDSVEEA
eukprot:GEMP01000302.1.p1 GENE.GEMP01000302.1~~GEMP01000302.1.p1  ORF type:complete len:1938 (+),score=492.38 GEMP01000302.1:750-5816(+)